ncbi:MAG: orotidine-5'-phosphate decarboxylase [Chloroflexi bacterium]|nr:orotidine-5'-phosphate decarboxylase [Chloroflexota bacterium]
MNFYDKLSAASERNQSLLCVGLDPTPESLPERYRSSSSPVTDDLLRWNLAVIEATAELVCCYKPNIAFYEALGAPGMDVLRRTIAAIPSHIPVLLDAKRGDIGSTAAAYARACFEELGVDAVTLSPYLGRDSIDAFAAYREKGLFVLCHTSNPSAGEFQSLPVPDGKPLYLQVAETATGWSPQVGLVVGATYSHVLADVRAAAPDAWFLVPGVGAQMGDLAGSLAGGLRPDGLGVLPSATRSVTDATDHRAAALALRDEINRVRSNHPIPQSPSRQSPTPSRRSLIANLHSLGAVQFGDFTLASGIQSPFYIDLRLLVSRPALLAQAAQAYAAILAGLAYDRIAGVPYAGLPIGTAVSLATGAPLIYPRKEVKQHGTGKVIEGQWQAGERIVIIEDLITSAGSIIQSAERLREAGLIVEDAIVLIDREQGGMANLAGAGIRGHAVYPLSAVLAELVAGGQIDSAMEERVLAFVRGEG